jgi:putative methionine-R-sulfoxide reductase with GAF domain
MDQTKQEMAGVQVAQLCKAKLLIGPFGGQQLTDTRSVRGRGTCESSHRRHAKLQRG